MRFTRLRAAGIAAGAALLVLVSGPANAGSTGIDDPSGVDYDAACQLGTSATPPGPNSIASSTTSAPGGKPAGDGCEGVSTYDGRTDGIDLFGGTTSPPGEAVKLESNASGQLVANWKVDGTTIPPAGSGDRGSYDLPDPNFVGGNYFALFQNKTIQTLAKYVACPQIPPRPTPIVNRFGTWKDGYHFFVAFSVGWDGTKWIHSAQLGQYHPDGGFSFFELGTNNGSGWTQANVYHPYGTSTGDHWSVSVAGGATGTTITVTAPGVYKSPDTTNCSNGHFDYWFAKAGDTIANVKGLTTANQVVTLPATVPLSATCGATGGLICESDLTTIGGFVFWVDTTHGNSTPGLFNTNISGIALTAGFVGGVDTLGPGPTCPTPTFGGLIQENPLWTVDTACHIDDDSTSRGSFFQEFWDTTFGFTF